MSSYNKKILVIIFILSSLLFYAGYLKNPAIYGDGIEYLSMTVSFFNHQTPDLREEDIVFRTEIELKNHIYTSKEIFYDGYFKSMSGKYYSYHFWIYSLANLPVFSLLHYYGLNELRSFQITNSLLLIFSLITILYLYQNKRQEIWFLLLTASNPILFYIPWTHAEVFIYSFIVISIIFWLNNRYFLAAMFSSIASLQSPPIIIFTLYLLISYLRYSKIDMKKFFKFLIPLLISIFPYIFYYVNYNKFSLIAGGASKIDNISINKILSLFFDLNFGIIAYMPIILVLAMIMSILDIKNKKITTFIIWIIILLMSIIYSTQGNWNHGMMYVNRYTIPIIPFLILIFLKVFENRQKINMVMIIALISTGIITGNFLYEYDISNSVKFSKLANMILINIPSVYNPYPEIFIERSLERELGFLPIIYIYDNKPRKILYHSGNLKDLNELGYTFNFTVDNDNVVHTDNNLSYINYPIMFKTPDINKIAFLYKSKDPDIIQNVSLFIKREGDHKKRIFIQKNMSIQMLEGFYDIEYNKNNSMYWRWVSNNAILVIDSKMSNISSLSFGIRSFSRTRTIQIYLNDKLIHEQSVPTTYTEIKIPIQLKEKVTLRFYISEGCQKNHDSRCLSVALMNIRLI